jgi:hypothetical protein
MNKGDKIDEESPPGTSYQYVKIHVCQASYGDCLALEFDDSSATPGSLGVELKENNSGNHKPSVLQHDHRPKVLMPHSMYRSSLLRRF